MTPLEQEHRVVLSRKWALCYRFWRPLWHWSTLLMDWCGSKAMRAEGRAYEHPWVTWKREQAGQRKVG